MVNRQGGYLMGSFEAFDPSPQDRETAINYYSFSLSWDPCYVIICMCMGFCCQIESIL